MAAFDIPQCHCTVARSRKNQQSLRATEQLNAVNSVCMWLELFEESYKAETITDFRFAE